MSSPDFVQNLTGTPQDMIPSEGWFSETCHMGTMVIFNLARYWGDGLWNATDETRGPTLLARSFDLLAGTVELRNTPEEMLGMHEEEFIDRYGLSQANSSLVILDNTSTLLLDSNTLHDKDNDTGGYYLGPILPSRFYPRERLIAPRQGVGQLLARITQTAELSDKATYNFMNAIGVRITEAV